MARTTKQPYTGAKRVDKSCRNHGTCPWCKGNRTIAARRQACGKNSDNPLKSFL